MTYLPNRPSSTDEYISRINRVLAYIAGHIAYVANLEGYVKAKIGQAWSRLCGWAAPLGLMDICMPVRPL